jgi:hypothetical protein
MNQYEIRFVAFQKANKRTMDATRKVSAAMYTLFTTYVDIWYHYNLQAMTKYIKYKAPQKYHQQLLPSYRACIYISPITHQDDDVFLPRFAQQIPPFISVVSNYSPWV